MTEEQEMEAYAGGLSCPTCEKLGPKYTGEAYTTSPQIYVFRCSECRTVAHISYEFSTRDSIRHEWRSMGVGMGND